ncbi:hypothetical protein DFP92_11780 [Yoonia sediminilitoris]|uniref:Uncharacterized protein n=1 Tax=Yoonia sediminilitoris TaxID=1286148 RepID=A0A2T6K7S2_9RHOB|nr:hypothetical protein C8N45_11780 [Yoonia sediminilitoris]RCW90486.1 hypothetical protein DFP92_11780 [Yoonia sediminilitoris]
MAGLLQLDEAERLDFGFYRVIRYNNQEVKAFLGEIVQDGDERFVYTEDVGSSSLSRTTIHKPIKINYLNGL